MPHISAPRLRAMLLWATTDTAAGLALILSGPNRVSANAYTPAKELAPMWVWGLVLALLGLAWLVIIALVRYRPRLIRWPRSGLAVTIVCALIAGWHVFFWVTLVFAAVTNQFVGIYGLCTAVGIFGNHLLFAADQRLPNVPVERRSRRRP